MFLFACREVLALKNYQQEGRDAIGIWNAGNFRWKPERMQSL